MFTGWMVFLKATKGMFTTRELSWTELNWPATSQPSYTTRSLVMCVSITAWLAAAKLGRLVFNQFVCYDMSTPTEKHVFRTPVNKLQFGSVQFACWEIHAGGMAHHCMNEITLPPTELVLGWVTLCGQVYHLGLSYDQLWAASLISRNSVIIECWTCQQWTVRYCKYCTAICAILHHHVSAISHCDVIMHHCMSS